MNPFDLVAGFFLLIIVVILAVVPFLILNKLEEMVRLLKSIDDHAAMQDYKSNRKASADEPR